MKYQRIRDLREDADLTQTQISQMLNISQRTYSHYELGTRELPIEILINLAHFYHTSTDYILGETNVKAPYPKEKPYLL